MQFYFGLTAAVTAVGVLLLLCLKNSRTANLGFCVFAFVVLGSLSAFRYMVGYDYGHIYLPLYEPFFADPFASSAGMPHEPGFILLVRLAALISSNPQGVFVFTSVLIVGLLMLYYYVYSPSPVISVFLFLSLSHYYCSMNFIRQTLAGVICLFAVPFVQQKKFVRYCLIVLLASLFHRSALVLLVFYFVNRIRMDGYTLSIYIPAAVIVYTSSTGVIELVTGYVYGQYDLSDPQVAAGFPIGFLLVSAALFALLFCSRRVLTQRDTKHYITINYAFFALLFMFLGTKHAILERFALYFNLLFPVGAAVVFSELCADFSKSRRSAISCAVFAAAVLLGGTAIHFHALRYDSHGVIPYRSVWNPTPDGGEILLEPVSERADEPEQEGAM